MTFKNSLSSRTLLKSSYFNKYTHYEYCMCFAICTVDTRTIAWNFIKATFKVVCTISYAKCYAGYMKRSGENTYILSVDLMCLYHFIQTVSSTAITITITIVTNKMIACIWNVVNLRLNIAIESAKEIHLNIRLIRNCNALHINLTLFDIHIVFKQKNKINLFKRRFAF